MMPNEHGKRRLLHYMKSTHLSEALEIQQMGLCIHMCTYSPVPGWHMGQQVFGKLMKGQ